MVIATIKPDEVTELEFDMDINGSKDEPTDIRFVIEACDEENVRDAFSVICKAYRTDVGVKVVIPRMINLLQRGMHRAKLEVVLENRLFVPLDESIYIEEPVGVTVTKPAPVVEEAPVIESPSVRVVLNSKPITEEKDEDDKKKDKKDDVKDKSDKKDEDDDDGDLKDRSEDEKNDKDKDNVKDKDDKDNDRDEDGETEVVEEVKPKLLGTKPTFERTWSNPIKGFNNPFK